MAQPADWYTDPTGRYQHRYWDGYQWTDQVSSGGPSAIDPNPLDPTAAATPPAPGSRATQAAPQAEAQPAVHVNQSSSGMGFGVILGAVIALIAVVVLVVVLVSGSDDTTDTTVPTETNPPATEAPAE